MKTETLVHKLLYWQRQNPEGFSVYVDNDGEFHTVVNKNWFIVSDRTILTINTQTGQVKQHSNTIPPMKYYGGWLDKETGIYYIEQTKVFLDKSRAMLFAVRRNQQYIWDTSTKKAIKVTTPVNIPSHQENALTIHQMWVRSKRFFKEGDKVRPQLGVGLHKAYSAIGVIQASDFLGRYEFLSGDILLSWYGIKINANEQGTDWMNVLVQTLSHESMHYAIHKEEGMEACVLFDVISGCASYWDEDNLSGMILKPNEMAKRKMR